jgi:CPA1 family monovalent cation:H+ antiporter
MTDHLIARLGLILLVASVVAIATQRARLPYGVGLVAAGIGLSLLSHGLVLTLTPNLIFTVFLPPLVFEAALSIRWSAFRREMPVILCLASAGVIIAAAVVAAGMHFIVGWPWIGAALFGTLIASTDPVAVIATFKEVKVDSRLGLLIEAESLVNDGVSAVGFTLLVGLAAGPAIGPAEFGLSLVWTVFGGVLIGGAVAGALLLLAGRTSDHLVEITLTTIAAYGSFLIANDLGTSGVLASLTAGMVVGNVGWMGPITETSREYVRSFWQYAAFLANSLVFILIGGFEGSRATSLLNVTALAAIPLVLLGRVAAVYPLCALFARSRLRVPLRHQHVLVWGGLRGALALALALALPADLPNRAQIVACAFAVVAFSVFVQGLTLRPLLRWLKLAPPDDQAAGR